MDFKKYGEIEKMKQCFVVREIILSRQRHIDYLKKTLSKTSNHNSQISLLKLIHDDEQDLKIFTNSENEN